MTTGFFCPNCLEETERDNPYLATVVSILCPECDGVAIRIDAQPDAA